MGENSQIEGADVTIGNAQIAIVSKDMSKVKLKNSILSDCDIGIAVYQKKSEFGPSFMDISNVKVKNIRFSYFVQENSILMEMEKPVKDNLKIKQKEEIWRKYLKEEK